MTKKKNVSIAKQVIPHIHTEEVTLYLVLRSNNLCPMQGGHIHQFVPKNYDKQSQKTRFQEGQSKKL